MKYISADELKKHWGILDFELLKFIRDGLPAYDRLGWRTITDSEVAYEKEETIDEFRKRLFLREIKHETERIEKNNSAEYAINAHRLIKAGLLDSELPPPEMYDAEKVRKRVETRIAEEYDLLPSFPAVPSDRRLLPADLNESDLHTLLDEIKTFQFKIQEINQFAQLHGLKLIEAEAQQEDATTQPPMGVESCVPEIKDYESFIPSLQVSFVSDTEIKIRGGGKNAKTYDMKNLGFTKEKSKTWKAFITILNSKDHHYHVGKAHGAKRERKTSYDVGQKVLVEINKKLVSFFNNTYQLQLTEKYKVYELIPEKKEAPGTYRFKFQIINNNNADTEGFEELSETELLPKIEELSDQLKILSKRGDEEAEGQTYKIKDQLNAAVEIACKNGWLTQNRAWSYLSPKADVPFVKYSKKIKGVWKSDINESPPYEPSIEDEDPNQED